jgi:signal transduction histidine kinase
VARDPGYRRDVRLSHLRVMGLPVADVALAIGLAVYAELDVFLTHEWHGNKPVTGVVVLAMALSLMWRRAAPRVTLALTAGGLVLLSLVYGGSETGANLFILIVASYSVALYGRDPLTGAVVYVIAAAVHTSRTPEVHGAGDWLWDFVMFGLAFGVGLAMRTRQERTVALEEHADALMREQEARAEAAADEERRRIARELHDIVSHGLGVMVLQAGAADQVLDREPARAHEVLASIRAVGEEAIGQMGTMLGLIRGEAQAPLEPQPTLADLDALVARTRAAGLQTKLVVHGNPRRLLAALELSAYRIVQEGLTNALKHASAARTTVTLEYGDRTLQVEVADDGHAVNGNGRGSRRGLAGIAERVAVFGGDLQAGPVADGGWVLRANFPVAQ